MADSICVILGMHRSGTSMLARILGRIGSNLGGPLLTAPAPDNPTGYWEHAQIARLQDELLARLGRRWCGPRGVLPLPEDWRHRPETRTTAQELKAIVRRDLARGGGQWTFKDPRTVKLLRLWQDIFAETGAEPIYVLAVRHPASVALSLKKRNTLTQEHAELLWLQHNLDAIRFVGDRLAVVVAYEIWFSDPMRNARKLSASLGLPQREPDLAEVCAESVRPELRHHREVGEPALPIAGQLHALLVERAPDPPSPATLREASLLLDQYDAAARLLAPWSALLDAAYPEADVVPAGSWRTAQLT